MVTCKLALSLNLRYHVFYCKGSQIVWLQKYSLELNRLVVLLILNRLYGFVAVTVR